MDGSAGNSVVRSFIVFSFCVLILSAFPTSLQIKEVEDKITDPNLFRDDIEPKSIEEINITNGKSNT